MSELTYDQRVSVAEGIRDAINLEGAFTAKTWCKPTTRSGYPAVNFYISDSKGQFVQLTVTKGGFVNVKALVDGTDADTLSAALESVKVAAGLEFAPRVHPDFTNIVPFSQLNSEKDDTESKPNTVDMSRFTRGGKAKTLKA